MRVLKWQKEFHALFLFLEFRVFFKLLLLKYIIKEKFLEILYAILKISFYQLYLV